MLTEFLLYTSAFALVLCALGLIADWTRYKRDAQLHMAVQIKTLANRMYATPGLTARGMRVVNVLDDTSYALRQRVLRTDLDAIRAKAGA